MKTREARWSRIVPVAALTLLMLPSSPAAADDSLTLPEAVAEALRGSDLLRAEQGRLVAVEGAVGAARSFLLPNVSVEERFLRTDNPAYDFSMKINQGAFTGGDLMGAPGSFNDPHPINDFQTTLTLSQPLYARRANLGLAMARAEAAAVELDHARRREEVAHAAMQAWLGAKAAAAYVDAAARAEEDAAEHVRLAQVAEQAGVGLASDRLRAAVALSEAKRARLAVDNNLEIARRGLGLALGRETAVVPAGHHPADAVADLDVLLGGVDGRADLKAMDLRVENARRNVDVARAERVPEVGLFGSLQANDPDAPLGTAGTSYAVGVGVTWRLSAWHSVAAARQAAGELLRAEGYRSGLAKEARFRVREVWLRWQEAKQGLALAEDARVAAEEGVRLVRLRYENGLATMVALLDAQSALNRARSDAARASADVAAALGELKFRSGLLLPGLQTASSEPTR